MIFHRRKTFLISSANLYRIITLPLSTLTIPWQYIGQLHSPVMFETWLRKSRVQLPTIVMLETWLREVPRLRNYFDKLSWFGSNYHTSFFDTNNSPVVYRTSISACHAWNMAAGEQGSTLYHSHTWNMAAREQGTQTVLISSANLYRIITIPFSTRSSANLYRIITLHFSTPSTPGSVSDKAISMPCLKHDCARFDSPP